jgi:hypothetical protein
VVEARRLSPDTEILAVGATVGDFWAWAFSDVLSNTARGVLAEFLVGSALGVVDGVRVEWDSFDLLYEGAKELGSQKRVGLSKISRMTEPAEYGLLKERVDQALNGAG